jgi:hypothetical protein
MDFIDNIKRYFGERYLRSKGETIRNKSVSNFSDARNIGIIYSEKGEGFFILVKQYVKYLKAEHGIRDVMAMAYIDDKKHVPHYQVHRLKFDYFTKAEIDWRCEPNCDQVKNFINTEFDILIDLDKNPSLPLRFLLAASKARFKVGHYDAALENFYDMMLKTPENTTFDNYISQVNHYLNLINTRHARA